MEPDYIGLNRNLMIGDLRDHSPSSVSQEEVNAGEPDYRGAVLSARSINYGGRVRDIVGRKRSSRAWWAPPLGAGSEW